MNRAWLMLVFLFPLVLIVVMTLLPRATRKLSPELQRFFDAYDQIQDEMVEGEVDKIFASYPSSGEPEERDSMPFGGGQLKRHAVRNKTYSMREPAQELDFYIQVFFDKDEKVVGKHSSQWIS